VIIVREKKSTEQAGGRIACLNILDNNYDLRVATQNSVMNDGGDEREMGYRTGRDAKGCLGGG